MEKQLGTKAAGAAGAVAAITSSPEQRAAGVSTQRVGATVKMVTVVEGEAISPQNMLTRQDGYLSTTEPSVAPSKVTLPPSPLPVQPTKVRHRHPHHRPPCHPVLAQCPELRLLKTPPKYRPAPLPKDDIKIFIRPRDGLNVANHSGTTLFNTLRQAAGLTLEETRGDHLSVNLGQNLLVLSSPNPDRAEKYAHITSLTLEDAVFSARGYIACPENTVKEVIHGIPPNYSAADIHTAVVQPCNPTALHARRMGQTNTMLVSFSGSRVPHYIDYEGTVTRCYIHKRKHEVCSACGKLGHRADVCPYPDRAYCAACGLANPMEEHECIIKCALCGLDHATGDAVCQQRYRTPFALRQRQQRRARSRSRIRNGEPHHNRDRTGSFPRLPSDLSVPASKPTTQSTVQRRRSRSKSKRRGSQPPPPATGASSDQRPSSQVSWAAVASPKNEQPSRSPALPVRHSSSNPHPPPPPPSSELAYLRTLLESVVAAQRQLQADVKQLQQAIRTPPPFPMLLSTHCSQCNERISASPPPPPPKR
ncbi:hypothetical protein HPB48_004421 [Haemaphysalis longicornis]|uniref:CCHC-type domain-containing protein n=1 Tax=Haemaphysalis longicornis TaxID=44386 RepID=A0A9J6FM45_HAELO|nr:hypothetical protein HPB48_004421 [Haemaphysalis longicornis]